MKIKFKVGDKVQCISTTRGANEAVIGDIGKIISIDLSRNTHFYYNTMYLVEFENERSQYHTGSGKGKARHCYWCSEKMLELISNRKPIVLYQNVNEVVALDKETGKKGIATCSPKDEFDFMTGAKLAFERLNVENLLEKFKFKIGDRVVSEKGTGTVICISDKCYNYGVQLDHPRKSFHDCIGVTLLAGTVGAKDSCWWFKENELELELCDKKAFCVGDHVKIINTGKIYPSDMSWVKKHVHDEGFRLRWAYKGDSWYHEGVYVVDDKTFKIIAIAEGKAYIVNASDEDWGKCYVIALAGLKKC